MADQMRSCRKTACRWPAAASLSFRYATKEVWLLDLSAEADPSLYDLCPHHADALTVPQGWTRVDQRAGQEAPVEPAASDRVAVAAAATAFAAGEAASRYDVLARDLPRLAREWANGAWNGETGAGGPELVVPPAAEDVPGQLAIPVEEEERDQEAVVVSIEHARRSTSPV